MYRLFFCFVLFCLFVCLFVCFSFLFFSFLFYYFTFYNEQIKGAFFYSQFWNENGQNVKCARFSIPHSYSGMDRMPFHPFCSQGQNEQNAANAFRTNHSYSRMVDKKRALILITCLHIQDLASIYTRLSIRETPKLFHKTER